MNFVVILQNDSHISVFWFWIVYGVEYAFGGNNILKPVVVKFGHFQGLHVRKSILIGRTKMDEKECQYIIPKSWKRSIMGIVTVLFSRTVIISQMTRINN